MTALEARLTIPGSAIPEDRTGRVIKVPSKVLGQQMNYLVEQGTHAGGFEGSGFDGRVRVYDRHDQRLSAYVNHHRGRQYLYIQTDLSASQDNLIFVEVDDARSDSHADTFPAMWGADSHVWDVGVGKTLKGSPIVKSKPTFTDISYSFWQTRYEGYQVQAPLNSGSRWVVQAEVSNNTGLLVRRADNGETYRALPFTALGILGDHSDINMPNGLLFYTGLVRVRRGNQTLVDVYRYPKYVGIGTMGGDEILENSSEARVDHVITAMCDGTRTALYIDNVLVDQGPPSRWQSPGPGYGTATFIANGNHWEYTGEGYDTRTLNTFTSVGLVRMKLGL